MSFFNQDYITVLLLPREAVALTLFYGKQKLLTFLTLFYGKIKTVHLLLTLFYGKTKMNLGLLAICSMKCSVDLFRYDSIS